MLVMDVLYKWVDTLKPYSNNNKKHSSKQIKMIADSISLFGFRNPIIIDKNNSIIAWHGRLLGAIQLWMQEVPTIVADDLTEEQVRAYRLLDNKIWDFWEYDMENILAELWDIGEFKLWFDTLNDLFGIDDPNKEEIEDEIPTIKTNPIVQVWDIFQLGNHRIMCWDSTKKEDVDKLMNGMKADLVVTDPPYNTGMQWKDDEKAWLSHMFNDKIENREEFITQFLTNYKSSTKWDCAYYVFIDRRKVHDIRSQMETIMDVKNVIVWDKKVHWLGSDYKSTYELCIVWKKGKPEINNRYGLDYQDIRRLQREMGRNKEHATAKPIELLEKPIIHASKADDIVIDLFLWSWSTLIACEKINRICYWMELDPKYIEVIIKRYYDYTEWKKDIKIINRDLDLSTITNA